MSPYSYRVGYPYTPERLQPGEDPDGVCFVMVNDQKITASWWRWN